MVDVDILADDTELTSIEGSPMHVTGSFKVQYNMITSLKGGPQQVDMHYFCQHNKLTDLEGAPIFVGKNFVCRNNQLTSLKGVPTTVKGVFDASSNPLEVIDYVPKKMGYAIFDFCPIKNLHNIHKVIKSCPIISLRGCPLTSHVLGLLKIKKLDSVKLAASLEPLEKIINKYLPEGDILECQQELIEAGFEEYAQL